jgi:hypothetical protein
MYHNEPNIPISTKYLDVSITNTTEDALLGNYYANLSQPIIETGSSGWDVSIVRASFPNSLIPLALKDWNDTDYRVTFSIGYDTTDVNYRGYSSSVKTLSITNGSKYIWNYQDYLQAINKCYLDGANALRVDFSDGKWGNNDGFTTTFTTPVMELDVNTKLFKIVNLATRLNAVGGTPETDPTKMFYMWVNTKFDNKFPFPAIQAKTSYSERIYLPLILQPISVIPPEDNLISFVVNGYNYNTPQDAPSLSLLSSIESIVVKTSLDLSAESSINNVDTVNSQAQSFSNILTDLEPQNNSVNGRELNGYDYYANQNARCYQVTNNMPLNKISVSFYWKSRTQQLIPLYIPYLSSINLKIRFRKIYDNRYITTN